MKCKFNSINYVRCVKYLVYLIVVIETVQYLTTCPVHAQSTLADENDLEDAAAPQQSHNHHHKQHGQQAKVRHHKSQRNTRRNLKTTTIELVTTTSEPVQKTEAPGSKAINEYKNIDYVANITAKVGETVVLYCAVNSSYGINPGVSWTTWRLTLANHLFQLFPLFCV